MVTRDNEKLQDFNKIMFTHEKNLETKLLQIVSNVRARYNGALCMLCGFVSLYYVNFISNHSFYLY